jgi:hypothetical protein
MVAVGRPARPDRRRRRGREEEIHQQRDQVGHLLGIPLRLPLGVPVLDQDILALDVAQLLQSLPERLAPQDIHLGTGRHDRADTRDCRRRVGRPRQSPAARQQPEPGHPRALHGRAYRDDHTHGHRYADGRHPAAAWRARRGYGSFRRRTACCR